MTHAILNARTVSVVRELSSEKRNGANGQYESKSITFCIAVDRDYRVPRVENGKTTTEVPTDFWLARASGAIAQTLSDCCTAKKENGKLVSRHLLLSGNFEKYRTTKMVKHKGKAHVVIRNVNINGALYNVEDDVVDVEFESEDEVENTIFVIDGFTFLDKKPDAQTASAPAAAPVAAPVATPIAATATPAAASPAQAVTATPQPVAQTIQATPDPMAAAVADMSNLAAQQMAMPATTAAPQSMAGVPVINPNFVPSGESAPF